MKENLRDILQLFVLPFIAALLPWAWGFRFLRLIAGAAWIFPTESQQALDGAKSLGSLTEEEKWLARHRLVRLVDHADLYLSLLRTNRWLKQNVVVEGEWPHRGPFLAAFFHWGAGLWGLRHLKQAGHNAAFLSIYFDRETFRHAPVRYWYARLRARETARSAGCPIIYTGNAPTEMRRLYRDGRNVTAALDVPLAQTRGTLPVKLFGREAWFPKGVIRLAQRMQIPIVVFSVSLDYNTGRRRLMISPTILGQSDGELASRFASQLEGLIASDPTAWHMWAHVQTFFADPGPNADNAEPIEQLA